MHYIKKHNGVINSRSPSHDLNRVLRSPDDRLYNNNNNMVHHGGMLLPHSRFLASVGYHLMQADPVDKPLNLETAFRRRVSSGDRQRSHSSNSVTSSCHELTANSRIDGQWSSCCSSDTSFIIDNIASTAALTTRRVLV